MTKLLFIDDQTTALSQQEVYICFININFVKNKN